MAASDVCTATTSPLTRHVGDGSLSPETASVLIFEMGQQEKSRRPLVSLLGVCRQQFRSHLIDSGALSLAGGATAFVTAWLDREAANKQWQRADLKVRQLSLDL